MKKYLLLPLLVFTLTASYSQIDLIEAAAGSADLIGDIASSGCMEGCIDGTFLFLFDEVFVKAAQGMSSHHDELLNNPEDFPFAVSLEYLPHFALGDNELVNNMQRIKGSWGVLTTDLRLNQLVEFHEGTAQNYQVIDWQIVDLNIYLTEYAKLTFGSGILYDNYAKRTFHENFASISANLMDQKLIVSMEGRFAVNYGSAKLPYKEANFQLNYLINERNNVSTYFMVGGLSQDYYSTVEFASLQSGLTFKLH